jgi:hypothetical protein
MTGRPRLARGYWVAFAILMGLWGVFAIWLAPAVIRGAYRGESFAFLNDVITGRAVHDVDYYLSTWSKVAWLLTGGLMAGGFVLLLALANRARIMAGLRTAVRGLPRLSMVDLLALAALVGVVAGLAEVTVRYLKASAPNSNVYPELFWTAPAGAVGSFVRYPCTSRER